MEDFYANLGYIVGPVLAGLLADWLGNAMTFSVLGFAGVVLAIVLLAITPASIRVRQSIAS